MSAINKKRRKLSETLGFLAALFMVIPTCLFAQFDEEAPQFQEQTDTSYEMNDSSDSSEGGEGTVSDKPFEKISPTNSDNKADNDAVGSGDEDEELLSLDFYNADIKDVARQMAELTQKNMIYENNISGKINLISKKKINKEQAFRMFVSSLNLKGYTIVEQDGFLKIVNAREAKKEIIPFVDNDTANQDDDERFVTKMIKIKYVDASEIANTLKPMVSHRNIRTYKPTNALLITDTKKNIKRIADMVRELDVPGFSERNEFVALKNATARDISKKITSIFNVSKSGSGFKKAAIPRKEGSSEEIITAVIADDRTNSLIVRGNEKGILAVKKLALSLDSDISNYKTNQRIFIYQLEHADAPKVAQILNSILSDMKGNSGMGGSYMNAGWGGGGFGGNDFYKPTSSTPGATIGQLNEKIKITADEKTNSLVIVATRIGYESLIPTIQKLDKKRKQVQIAATIMEISLGNGWNFGAAGYGGGNKGKAALFGGSQFKGMNASDPKSLAGLQGLVMGMGTATELNLGKGFSIPAFGLAVNAAAGDGKAKVLSNPRVVTLDNEPARIEVGKDIWVKNGYQTSPEGGTTNYTFSKEQATLTIEITPKINKSNDVTMKIDQKVQDAIADSDSPAGRALSKRNTKTVVMAKNSETIAIGGLISDKEKQTTTKVPVLGDIPVLGWLFKNEEKSIEKTNLILFVTPTVIESGADAKKVTENALNKRNRWMGEQGLKADNWVGTNDEGTHTGGIVINWNSADSGNTETANNSNEIFEDDTKDEQEE